MISVPGVKMVNFAGLKIHAMGAKWRYAAIIAALVICVSACAFGAVLQERTLVQWTVPVGIAAGAGLVTVMVGTRLWRWLTGSRSAVVNGLCHVLIVGALVYPGFLAANMYLADEASEHSETVTVVGKCTRKHDTHRRIRRNTYVKSGVRYTYHVEIAFPSGSRTTVQVPRSRYGHYRCGRQYDFVMCKGLFGIPVIKDMG